MANNTPTMLTTLVLTLCLGTSAGGGQAVLFVNASADGANNGTSWGDAYTDLQDALAHAGGSDGTVAEIWVAAGVYTPPSTPCSTSFQLINGVAIYGGFAGEETTRGQRDPVRNETILSGDVNGDDPGEVCSDCCCPNGAWGCNDGKCQNIICAMWPPCCGPGGVWDDDCAFWAGLYCRDLCPEHCVGPCTSLDNSYHVLVGDEVDATAVLDGFVITAGYGRSDMVPVTTDGGGLLILDGSPTVRNCTFIGNVALGGGGVSVWDGSPQFTNCRFIGNRSGGAAFQPFIHQNCNPTLINCTFRGNTADYDGGGICNDGGLVLINCAFIGNSAGNTGGGIYSSGPGIAPRLTNCLFSGNSATLGGGIYNRAGGDLMLSNCTFSGNLASDEGGGIFNHTSDPTLTNCVFWGNSDAGGTDQSAQIYVDSGTPEVSYSCVQDDDPEDTDVYPGPGNVDDDPLFVNPDGDDGVSGTDDDDLRLSPDSPGINAGDPGVVPQPGAVDLDGHARVLCSRVDMGAYEFGIGDFECDRDVDLDDFASWPSCMTGPANAVYPDGCEAFDFDFDSDVDLSDFGVFLITFRHFDH